MKRISQLIENAELVDLQYRILVSFNYIQESEAKESQIQFKDEDKNNQVQRLAKKEQMF